MIRPSILAAVWNRCHRIFSLRWQRACFSSQINLFCRKIALSFLCLLHLNETFRFTAFSCYQKNIKIMNICRPRKEDDLCLLYLLFYIYLFSFSFFVFCVCENEELWTWKYRWWIKLIGMSRKKNTYPCKGSMIKATSRLLILFKFIILLIV